MLQKSRSKVERETKGMRGCEEKMKKRTAVQHWNMVVKKKQGKNESNVRIKRRKKEAKIAGKEDRISTEEAEEEWQNAVDDWGKYKQNKKEERDKKMLELHEVELPLDTEK